MKDYKHLINLKKKRIEEIDAKLLKKKEMKDMVNKPPHYTNKIECLDIIEQQVKDPASVYEAHIWRYLYRHKDKGANIVDLEKAEFYLKRLIKHYKNL